MVYWPPEIICVEQILLADTIPKNFEKQPPAKLQEFAAIEMVDLLPTASVLQNCSRWYEISDLMG